MTGVLALLAGLGARRFTPADIPAVKAWWSPEFGVTMDGSNLVSAWADRIGGHTVLQATAGNKPTWRANAATMLGGVKPLMHCTDADRFLEMAAFPASFPVGADEIWAFAASRLTATGSAWTPAIFGYGGQRGIGAGGVNWNTQTPYLTDYFAIMGSGGSDAINVNPSMLTNAVVAAKWGPSIVGRRNGAQVGTTGAAASITTGNLRIGRRTNGTDNIIGYLGDVIVTSALTTAEVEKLEGWMAWNYGQQGLLPSGHTYKNAPP